MFSSLFHLHLSEQQFVLYACITPMLSLLVLSVVFCSSTTFPCFSSSTIVWGGASNFLPCRYPFQWWLCPVRDLYGVWMPTPLFVFNFRSTREHNIRNIAKWHLNSLTWCLNSLATFCNDRCCVLPLYLPNYVFIILWLSLSRVHPRTGFIIITTSHSL